MNLENLFVCPKCKHKMDKQDQFYTCQNCQVNYPVIQNIPVFITGEAQSDNINEFWDKGWEQRVEAGDHQYLKADDDRLKETLEQSIKSLRAKKHIMTQLSFSNEEVFLNIGCGTGEAPLFAAMGVKNYIGIDYSFNAARYSYETIKKLQSLGITAQANAELLPIETDSVDIVYSYGVLHHTPETQKTLDEVFRVLKPKARGIIGLYNTYSPHFINSRVMGTAAALIGNRYKTWYERTERAWMTENLTNPWTKTYSKAELKKLFSKYDIENLKFKKEGFSWANAIPKLGRHIQKAKLGQKLIPYLESHLGGMWIITFTVR